MQQLLLFFMVALPMMLFAQTSTSVSAAHQQVEANFMAKNPQIQKVDLEKITAEQKNDKANCSSCGSQSTSTPKVLTAAEQLELLQTTQESIKMMMTPLIESKSDNETLLKYKKALIQNIQQIETLETELDNLNKIKKKEELKLLKKTK